MQIHDKNLALSAEDVSIAYGSTLVVRDVDLEVAPGTMTAIVGPNGAGKSTFIKGCLSLLPLLSGSVAFFGESLNHVRKRIAYVPQTDSVNWDFPATVFDVALMGRYVHKGWIKRTNAQDTEIALKALDTMGMLAFKNRQISQLSGGQKQRVFLARALAQQPDLFILDEPLAGIDKTTEMLIIDVLSSYKKENKTIIAVHHDLATIPAYFDHVAMMNKKMLFAGDTEYTFTSQHIEHVFNKDAGALIGS